MRLKLIVLLFSILVIGQDSVCSGLPRPRLAKDLTAESKVKYSHAGSNVQLPIKDSRINGCIAADLTPPDTYRSIEDRSIGRGFQKHPVFKEKLIYALQKQLAEAMKLPFGAIYDPDTFTISERFDNTTCRQVCALLYTELKRIESRRAFSSLVDGKKDFRGFDDFLKIKIAYSNFLNGSTNVQVHVYWDVSEEDRAYERMHGCASENPVESAALQLTKWNSAWVHQT